ncbi:uncharacterized protein LOC114264053 [Camellia sinensis]|uniref:uncharacterized protein LOC114264053 n=1 Tax=Camellia sinensis TaxID=4442 RepID=UPI00103578EB|nr:uncharacterized protein LOC114264053 [Camellia sinensis]
MSYLLLWPKFPNSCIDLLGTYLPNYNWWVVLIWSFGAMRSQRLAHSTVILIYPINSCFVARALLLLEGQISRFSIVKWRVFEKSLQYVKHFSCYKNQDSIRQAREYPLII